MKSIIAILSLVVLAVSVQARPEIDSNVESSVIDTTAIEVAPTDSTQVSESEIVDKTADLTGEITDLESQTSENEEQKDQAAVVIILHDADVIVEDSKDAADGSGVVVNNIENDITNESGTVNTENDSQGTVGSSSTVEESAPVEESEQPQP